MLLSKTLGACFAVLRRAPCESLAMVTLEHCPFTRNQAAAVTEGCDRMRDGQAGSVLVTDSSGTLVGSFTGRARCAGCWRNAVKRPRAPGGGHDTKSHVNIARSDHSRRVAPDEGWRLPGPTAVEEHRIVGLVSRGEFHGLRQRDDELGVFIIEELDRPSR